MEQTIVMTGLSHEVAELRQDMHARFAAMDQRFTAIDQKLSAQFLWLVGLIVSGGLVLLTALLTSILRH